MNYVLLLVAFVTACSVPPQHLLKDDPVSVAETQEPTRAEPAKPEPAKPETVRVVQEKPRLKECAEINTGDPQETAHLKLDCMLRLAPEKHK